QQIAVAREGTTHDRYGGAGDRSAVRIRDRDARRELHEVPVVVLGEGRARRDAAQRRRRIERRDRDGRGLRRAQALRGVAVVGDPGDGAGRIAAVVGRVGARLELHLVEYALVVRERVGAREDERLGAGVVARRDAGAGRRGAEHVAVAREGAGGDLHGR